MAQGQISQNGRREAPTREPACEGDHGAVIVEDDYDGEFRYEGSPLELRPPTTVLLNGVQSEGVEKRRAP